LLAQYKKGVMQQIFSQQLRFKDDDGRDFPEWEDNLLVNYSETIQSGKSKARNAGGDFVLYGSTGAIGFTDNPEYEGKAILIARVGANAGYIYEVNGEYCVSDNTLILILKKSNNYSFFFNLLTQANLNKLVFGSGQPLITGGQLKQLSVTVPSFDEQTKIANFLTAIDDKINNAQAQLAAVKQYKQGLLQQMFV
jgi:type I restriction enzyme, S subunit